MKRKGGTLDKLKLDRKTYYILFAAMTLLFIATRLFRLDQAPFTAAGMHFDEMSAAYDAWCIQGWGVDRHLTRFPVYFMNTGPGQNALYIYLAAIMFKFFGFTLFKFRLIAVICASAAYVCMFFLARKLFGDNIYSLVPNALMTVMPVYFMSEHWGLESYLFLSFSIISIFLMILSLEKQQLKFYILSGVSWGITFYTYGVSYLVVPLFFFMAFIWLLFLKRMDLKTALGTAVPMALLGAPLAVEQLVIQGVIQPFSIAGMDFFPMEISRVKEVSFAYIPHNILTSAWVLLVKDYLYYSSVPKFGTIMYVSMPFMIIGGVICVIRMIRSVRNKEYDPAVLLFLFYIAGRFISLMTKDVNTNKANELYFPYLIFTAIGIEFVCKKVKKEWCLLAIAAVYMLFFAFFAKWAYSGGENSWNYQTRPRLEEYIVEDIHNGLAIQEAKEIAGEKKLQMMINGAEGKYLQICLFAGTSPYDYNEEGFDENGYEISIPEELDLTGDRVYLIEDELHHITDYLVSEGFTRQEAKQGQYSIVYR